ncbi:phage major capsid protein [Jiella marina]|uniref:phage major capsid protein n=1 Tax=Jiella sp. LLJ827 TaxID=2917712 RepID=UPI0021006E5C|nr:phage major capsid protein [Jiella sp. LLJ827]MCQ0986495.1 phage major capsid protein [Jiella sp. LLJ827]
MDIEEIKSAFDAHDEAVTKRIDDLAKELKAANDRADKLETAFKRSPTGGERKNDEPTIEQKAFNGFLRHGVEALAPEERKSLTVGENTRGGYLVTSQFSTEVLKNLVEISPVRQAARVGTMNSSEFVMPKRTARPTAYWVGETEDRTGTEAAYGQVSIIAHETACYVDVSQQLLEDAAVDVEAEVSMDLAEEFGRIEGEAFVTGNGVKKPFGFMNDDDVAIVDSGSATAVTADSLISILYSLPSMYRNRATWMMNSDTLGKVRLLKDGQGQYLWQPGIAAGQPETLLGRPIVDATDMPDVAGGATPIAVGDFNSAYRIMDRVGMTLLRDPYTMATKGLIRFHARRRVGADVVKAEALRKLRIAA